MFNIHMGKRGKTQKSNIDYIKQRIVEHRDWGYCDSEGRTIERKDPVTGRGMGPQRQAGKGDRDRMRHNYDLEELYEKAARNIWPRDENGNLIED